MNSPERGVCSRCSGSLAPPPARDESPLPPVLPVTARAEVLLGHARAARAGNANEPGLRSVGAGRGAPGELGNGDPGTGDLGTGDVGTGDLYLLATERSTGQPAPPEGTLGQSGPVRAERPGRMAIGLSGA